ncbi:MAG: divinyl protochlorophyllide a 8-vinyl-reductase BchJ [Rhodobacteraceae bacterium HLUCCA08]|nr:MAG: divinyl protochlorophyllide a 8-vinyl-reductase BchJ [Rhodobacteraceae bacterium HLUCCA08]
MAGASAGEIGPNAILQMLPAIEDLAGDEALARIRAGAGLVAVPDGHHMIPEVEAARLHAQLRRQTGDDAPRIAAEAGRRTADYILAHRIPAPAQAVLRALPAALAAPLLSRAIAQHAWTFAGSGAFHRRGAWVFEITDNPLIRGERADRPLCAWHAAVFERLYRVLVAPDARCTETRCAAQGQGACCSFSLTRGG